jgi:hypothetical protein
MPAASSRALAAPALLAAAAALGLAALAPPAPLPADAPAEVFSAARAQLQQQMVAASAHPIGSPSNAAVRDRLVAELTALGFTVEVARGPVANGYGRRPAASFAFVENIVARKAGREGGPALVLMSHYDARWHAPGAGDAGSGVATVLEAARALGQTPLARDLLVVFTDGEEVGLLGAQRWVAALPERADIGLLLNFEARGTSGPAFMFETSPGNGALIAAAAASLRRPTAQSLGYEVYRRMPNDTDFSVVKAAGIQGLNFAPIGTLFDYHSPTDTPANFDPATLQQQGEYAVALARRFGSAALPLAPADDVVFFDLLGRRLVSFPLGLGHALTLAAGLLLAQLGWRLRRSGRLSGGDAARASLAVGATLLLVAALGTAGGAWIGADELRRWAAIARLGPNAFGWAAVGGGATLLVAALALHGVAWRQRRSTPVGLWPLALAGLALWFLIAVAAALAAPTASYAFGIPLLLALLGHHAALEADAGSARARPYGRDEASTLAPALGAVWGFSSFAVLVWLFHQALGYAAPALTMALAMLLPWLALPASAPGLPRGRAAAALPLVGGLVLLMALALTPPWNARTPKPVDAFAIADHDAGGLWFASGDGERDAWQLGLVPTTAKLESWARLVPGNDAPLWTAPARGAKLGAAPALEPLPSASASTIKRARFLPPPQALAGSIWIRSEAPLARVAMGGLTLALPTPNADGWRRLRWYALPPEGVALELELERAAKVELLSVSLVPGFPKPYDGVPAARLPATMPPHYGYGDSTAVLKRFEL